MHLLFERSQGRFKTNCNILALTWMPYYDESKFRQALFDYHQRQLINLSQSISSSNNNNNSNISNANNNNPQGEGNVFSSEAIRAQNAAARVLRAPVNSSSQRDNQHQNASETLEASRRFHNSRLAELYQRYQNLRNVKSNVTQKSTVVKEDVGQISKELDVRYGRLDDFGWLVVGNVGKIVGVTLTSIVDSPQEKPETNKKPQLGDDLMVFVDPTSDTSTAPVKPSQAIQADEYERMRPDKKSVRSNYNLRGHLDEVILVRWNELYQKLATVDSKGNVLIWCKVNNKFTIQTPFYNRAKSVADFKWSNDGKTALICYTDSFILVGSSSGQRHWHSMLNLEDYHITCASWTPNDEQLLLGVSNGNVVVIDLPRSELTELVVNQAINIRAMCWSSSEINLKSIKSLSNMESDLSTPIAIDGSEVPASRRNSTIVNHRRLSRDCSVFSRYRYSLQSQTEENNIERLSGSADAQNTLDDQSNCSRIQSSVIGKSLPSGKQQQHNILAIDFANGTIKLYREGLDDIDPKTIQVNQESYIMQWSSDGNVLVVGGFSIHTTAPSVGCLRCRYVNILKFYNQKGDLIYLHNLKYTRYPITALTWAHDNSRLFVATGPQLHCARVYFGVAPLALLAASCFQRLTKLPDKNDIMESVLQKLNNKNVLEWQSFNCPINIMRELTKSTQSSIEDAYELNNKSSVHNNSNVYKYQLPLKLQSKIDDLFAPTIKQPYDQHWTLNDIVWQVPKNNQRYYCTLVCYTYDRDISSSGYQYRIDPLDRHSDSRAGDQYKIFVLYVEFQGSLVPILRARRVGFLKPEFVIFDPEDNQLTTQRQRKVSDISQQSSFKDYNQRRHEYQHSADISPNLAGVESPLLYYNDNFTDNCSDLHMYSGEPRASNSSLGRQSMSDAEHYYNFECDTVNRRNQDKMAELLNGRSHHQEPIAIPMTSSPYILYSLALPIGNYVGQQNRNTLISPTVAASSTTQSGRSKEQRNRVRGLGGVLTEGSELVRIRSNIWGTKFKMINASNRMIRHRSILGTVVYKASILHLQPRQILLSMKDMSNYCCLCSKHHHNRVSKKPTQSSSSTTHDNKMSMLDLPNPDSTLWKDVGGNKHKNAHRHDQERDKVVLPVGDSLKISDVNQCAKLSQMVQVNSQAAQNSLTRSSRSRPCSSSSNHEVVVVSSERKSRRRAPTREISNSTILQPIKHHLPDGTLSSIDSIEKQKAAQEDILTLSLGQGDQVRVEMSSIKKRDEAESPPHPSTSKDNSSMDDFLATNKTLKSIQTITKMIVDLSSKATEETETDERLLVGEAPAPSPSKLVKLCRETGGSSSDYVAPATPVHRPRRTQLSKEVNDFPSQTQSATSTPLKFLDSDSRRQQRRLQSVKRNANSKLIDNSTTQQPPVLKPPTLSVPIGWRLSYSAKRLIDGSLRSLYSSAGYSASDVEPEESEPLVVTDNRVRFGKALDKKAFLKPLGQSQPCTPAKQRTLLPKQSSSDLSSFRSQLLHRLRGARLEQDTSNSVALSCNANSVERSTRTGACSTGGSTSQLDKFASKRLDSSKKALRGSLLMSPDMHVSSSSEDLSDSNCDDLEVEETEDDGVLSDLDLDIELASTDQKKRSNKFSWSNSVKDLRDFNRFKTDQFSRKCAKASDNSGDRPHRRRRRKSICQNSGCCCAREFRLKNRPPVWNESSQIYQLDFGGRVTQESAKNLQIDYAGNLALQFGRIDRCTYTLDYKYPFNAVQAMAVALASLTQRLK